MCRAWVYCVACFLFLACAVQSDAGSKKRVAKKIKEPAATVEEVKEEIAKENTEGEAILALRVELLNWKKKYYIEHSITMQLRVLNELWNNPEFQESQKKARELDKQLKKLMLLQ